jgi:hypothetical protein
MIASTMPPMTPPTIAATGTVTPEFCGGAFVTVGWAYTVVVDVGTGLWLLA